MTSWVHRWAPLKAIAGSADDVVVVEKPKHDKTTHCQFRVSRSVMVFNNADVDSFDSAKRQLATRR